MGLLTSRERLLRRAWLLDNLELLQREAVYHRTHEVAESSSSRVLWHSDQPDGQLRLEGTEDAEAQQQG